MRQGTCAGCGALLPVRAGPGRPVKWCDECRRRIIRDRKRQRYADDLDFRLVLRERSRQWMRQMRGSDLVRRCVGCDVSLSMGRTKQSKWCPTCKAVNDAARAAASRGLSPFVDKNRQCGECGDIFLAKDRRGRFCSKRCGNRHRLRQGRGDAVCEWCGALFRHQQSDPSKVRFCSRECRGMSERRAPVPTSSRIWIIDCLVCAKTVTVRTARQRQCGAHSNAEYAAAKYHADKAAQGDGRTPENWRRNVDRRNRRMRDRYVEDVSFSYIAKRDGWRCHLCGRPVPRGKRHPHPNSASLDHIVPLSRDGEHSKSNVALAHLHCNLEKNNGVMGEQLRLIG